jgi:cytochrome P450
MVQHAARLLDSWRDGDVRNIHAEMMMLALQIVCEALFGADITRDGAYALERLSALHKHFERWVKRALPLPWTFPTLANLRMKDQVRELDAILSKMIADRRNASNDRDDLLSMLIEARDEEGNSLSDRQLRDELMTMFVAGYETTALALTWSWYLLSQHPAIEAKFISELDDVTGRHQATLNDLGRLRLTESIVKEALRLYPPIYSQGRETLRECQIGGYRVPAHTQLFVSQWIVQRDPRFFDDPDAFKPERWLDGSTDLLSSFAYFPFGGGPRVCLGASFAMMEATLVMASIGRRFRLELLDGGRVMPVAAGTLQPVAGLPMVLRSRTNRASAASAG